MIKNEIKGKKEVKRVKMVKVMMVVMGCNSGVLKAEQGKNKFLQSLVNVSNEFLNVFTSFGDMVGSVLGFSTETKKSDVGKYFKKVQETVEGTKTALEQIVVDMKTGGNPNFAATETSVKKLVSDTLDKIINGAKTAKEAIGNAGEFIANVATAGAAQNNGGAGDVDKLVKGIKDIVDVVLKGKGNAEAGDNNKAEDLAIRNNSGAIKLFASDNSGGNEDNTKKLAADASKAVGAVTGADILQAMIKDNGAAAKLAKNSSNNAANVDGVAAPKDAEVAGGIALRAIAKGGKFANANNSDAGGVIASTIKGAAISAVTKVLDTLTIAIRSTIDSGLKEVKEAMKINANATPVVSDKDASGAKN
ncbi:variable large family protein [Borrelia hispanica]|uniref:variable large family protein n=1 Tax=Borrelia hispanica TaxID=40835 RepID=UPI0004B6D3CF|nr:variable large family protein [Borrelia hispanica]